MILVFSFARSGSTLVLDFLSDLLGFNCIFEPLMQEPEKIKGHPNFGEIHDRFRGGPSEHKLHEYKIGDFYLGHIPEVAFNSDQIKPHKEKLKNYLGDIYRQYGKNTVIKFVRQQGNIPFLHSIMRELNITPGYILLKRNPYEIAYSYYRMGGFHRRSTWGVNRLFQYRRHLYRGESKQIDAMFNNAKHPFDKLIVAILVDYRAFDLSARWLQDKGIHVLSIEYEHFIKNTPDLCREISSSFNIPISETVIQKTVRGYNFNSSKVSSSRSDPLYAYLSGRSRQRMSPWLSQYPLSPQVQLEKGRLKFWHVKCLLKNVLPLIKVS